MESNEPIYDCFAQEYDPSNNKTRLVGTDKFPFVIVGEVVEYKDNLLSIKAGRDDQLCIGMILHRWFGNRKMSLSFWGNYIQNVTAFPVERNSVGEDVITIYEIRQ